MDVGRNVCGRFAPYPWGETSYARIAHGAKCLVWGETSMGRIPHGAKCPYYLGAKRPWGELSVGRKVLTPY